MKYWRKPLDQEKYSKPTGEIHIIADRCKGCNFCIEFCPNEVLKESEEYNIKGYHPPEPKDPDNCIACKLCELICPDFAIYVIIHDQEGVEDQDTSSTKADKEVAKDV